MIRHKPVIVKYSPSVEIRLAILSTLMFLSFVMFVKHGSTLRSIACIDLETNAHQGLGADNMMHRMAGSCVRKCEEIRHVSRTTLAAGASDAWQRASVDMFAIWSVVVLVVVSVEVHATIACLYTNANHQVVPEIKKTILGVFLAEETWA